MRELAAIAILVICTCQARAHHSYTFRNLVTDAFTSTLNLKDQKPLRNTLDCTENLGLAKCFNALGVWCVEKSKNSFVRNGTSFNFNDALEDFPWDKFSNTTSERLNSDLSDGVKRLLERWPLEMAYSTYKFQLGSNTNGLKLDVYPNKSVGTSRGKGKKLKSKLMSVLPLIVLPGMTMAAILPFFLPALSLSVLGVGMLNNMALTSAIFSILRNNAFSENHHHKIIYANEGYKNEKHHYPPIEAIHEYPSNLNELTHEGTHNEELVIQEKHGDAAFEADATPAESSWTPKVYSTQNEELIPKKVKRSNVRRKRRKHRGKKRNQSMMT